MYRTHWQGRFLGLEEFLINALHNVTVDGQRKRSLDYISGGSKCPVWIGIERMATRAIYWHLSYTTGKWVGIQN